MCWIAAGICWNPAKYSGLPVDSSIDTADFQHWRILFSPGSTQDQLYFNRDQLKKGPFGLFKTVFVVSLCTPPQALRVGPGWAPSDWRWLGLRYKLTEILSFEKSSERSRCYVVFSAQCVNQRRAAVPGAFTSGSERDYCYLHVQLF